VIWECASSEAAQECEEFVAGLVSGRGLVWWGHVLEGGFLGREVGLEVLVGGGGIGVPESEGDHGEIDA
jgi:hypothetical protein